MFDLFGKHKKVKLIEEYIIRLDKQKEKHLYEG